MLCIGHDFHPIILRYMGTNKKSSNSFKDIPVFMFCHTILLRSAWTSSLMENTIILKEIQDFRVKVFSAIV
jgi:hypothetical protein